MIRNFTSVFILLVLLSCNKSDSSLFSLLPAESTGITFENTITEDSELNIINEEYLYNGGGIAAADFDNDGKTDLFFTGNMVENQLYLNRGEFKFDNVSSQAGIQGKGRWKSGVAVIDINNDNLLDLYVCASISEESEARKNMLFVNQGRVDEGGISFKEEAEKYGIADTSYSSNAIFLDYDKDGDQDLFVLVNSRQLGVQTNYRERVLDGSSNLTDKLYRNNGDQTFTDVSRESGILVEGHGLGVSIVDINNDGWLDIYIANDFQTSDVLYVNHEGVFKDEIDQYFKHQSKFSMGTDAADINNDGNIDLITVDMMPEINERKKTVIGGGMYINYINDARYGYTHQYSRNMLQLNNGEGEFSEIGQFSGVHQTEWSWSPLLADFDNDGYRDLLITNGFPKDLTDKDFINFRGQINQVASPEYLMKQLPSVKVPNYAFKNRGNNTFAEVSTDWGISQPSFSNGAIYADLDNDGDLDYVVNNIDDKAFVYKNNTIDGEVLGANFLRLDIAGAKGNTLGIGSKIIVHYDGKKQTHLHSIYRGYISSVEPTIHFGLGSAEKVDSIEVFWTDSTYTVINDVSVNTKIDLNFSSGVKYSRQDSIIMKDYYAEIGSEIGIAYKQDNYDIVDYSYQRTLPHKFTQYGPAIAVGDINGDGLEDFVIGTQNSNVLDAYLQDASGNFESSSIEKSGIKSDAGILLFDADGDEDLDLYVVGGGYESPANDPSYQDHFYRNEDGRFSYEKNAIPTILNSGSVARGGDFDQDGDLDLFVAGRVIPHSYPLLPENYFLRNRGGRFEIYEMGLQNMGMVSDALWSDFNNDGLVDLITVGEFSAIRFYENNGGTLAEVESSGVEDYKGWWNSIVAGDFDRDGDIDYVAGNLGQNNSYAVSKEHPMFIYASDIDKNGSVDPVLACYFRFADGDYKLCPVNYWEELSAQSPVFRKRFNSYKSFGRATLDSVLTKEEQEASLILEANHMESSYIENLGNGMFRLSPLPLQVQIAPVFGMQVDYIDDDLFLDLVLHGNDLGNEVAVGDLDALNGMILLGDGKGGFIPESNGANGFQVSGNGKALVNLIDKNHQLLIASQNKDSIKVFEQISKASSVIPINSNETSAVIEFENDQRQKTEFYFGSGFYSQSSRAFKVFPGMRRITFFDKNTQTRKVEVSDLTQ